MDVAQKLFVVPCVTKPSTVAALQQPELVSYDMQVTVMISFIMSFLILGAKGKRNCISASILSFVFRQEKIQAASVKPEPDNFCS